MEAHLSGRLKPPILLMLNGNVAIYAIMRERADFDEDYMTLWKRFEKDGDGIIFHDLQEGLTRLKDGVTIMYANDIIMRTFIR